jgi:hypothetical protein
MCCPFRHSSNPLPQRRASKTLVRTKQFTCLGITVFAHLAAGLATAIQVLRCQDRERSCVVPSWELILQSEDARGSPLIRGTAGECRSRGVRANPHTRQSLQIGDPIFIFQQTLARSIPRTYDPCGRVNIGSLGTVGYRYFYA